MRLPRFSPTTVSVAAIILSSVAVLLSVLFVLRAVSGAHERDIARILREIDRGLLCVELELVRHRLNTTQHHEKQADVHGSEYEPEAPLPRTERLNPAACDEYHNEENP